ncbi:unnamed protein product [Lactuca saligna]|uniref:Uncharacterized protein n=1 Tax=Lactuca saligna TaxID=75948 RepID=A0AA35V6X0_LACSI|nr:unnamed protein product [Lactuca saligna]
MGFASLQRDAPVKSNIEVNGNICGNVETFNVDTTTNLGDPSNPSIPEQTQFIPPKVSMTESVSEEVRTSGIPINIFDMDTNVNKGDGMLTHAAQGISNVSTSYFDPEEENIPDQMLMSGKQFKTLNCKLNSLLQLRADKGNQNIVSGIEVDVLLKAQEHRLKTIMDQIDTKNEERLKRKSDSFNH